MQPPGIEAGIHVFFALLSLLSASALLALLHTGSTNVKMIRALALGTAILVWLAWLASVYVYTVEYPVDKALIVKYPQTALAHKFGMEVKEHIFYTGLLLSTLLPIFAYTDLEKSRKLLLWATLFVILGGIVEEILGGWVSISAKIAWTLKAGGG
ncbi:hypothetical protein IG193_00545 [Infirmifilum lucidum]|uniref:Uncharacterized protein n=1 Tax=Infirmifilum lucidum TaxID=2776706 RepID=A0A7L9FGQ7_9CREN|nr:hypothetical protein [Infirmifilum lucidum]QOJ78990.1 hypothetical protein IG193_00545 [Infirmifilum lucidum]